MSFLKSIGNMFSKASHYVEKKIENTAKHVASDLKKAEKTMHRAVHQVEKRVEHAAKEVKKDVVHISREAKEAFHHAEKKAEQVVKHATHHVKKAEKAVHRAVHQVEKRVEHAAKEVKKDVVHISREAKEAFHYAEKKAEQVVKHATHHVKKAEKAIHRAAHHIEHKLGHEIKVLAKTADRGAHKIEQKAEHIAKQTVHDIIHAGHKVEQTARQVAKNAEKSWHGLTKHPIESTVEFVRGAGDAALQDVTYNLAHRSYHSPHPVAYEWGQMTGHAVSTVAGVVETAGAIPLAAAGIALSGTGVGAAIGVPATAIAAMGAAHGATLATTGSSHFVQHANELYQRMSRGEGGSGKAVKGTDEAERLAKGTGNSISDNMKTRIPNNEIFAPNKRGNAPISKKDNRPIEIHHEGQNPNGPFHEMHASDHRFGENYKMNHPCYNEKSGIDRKQFRKDVRKYWESEWDRGRFDKWGGKI
ncbi:HNH/ENDO VII family nuclease [Geobacillus icigianus]